MEEKNRCAAETSNGAAAPRVHLLLGPVGAGKSTLALRLAREHAAVYLNLDEWMAVLFRPDRPAADVVPWYVERAQRCVDQIWTLTERLIDARTSVVLELGLIRRHERERFFQRVDARGYPLTVYVVDAPRALRRRRVQERNTQRGDTFSMVVPPEVFELASDLWEPLEAYECAGRDMR
jgi:predicted kinase